MSEELSRWISLKDFFLLAPANIRNSCSVNNKILNSHIIEVNFKGIFLRCCLIHNKEIKSKRNGLVRFESGEDSGNNFSSVG